MPKPLNYFLILNLLLICVCTKPARAEEKPFRIMLFSGNVILQDKQQRRVPAAIGLSVGIEKYENIELSPGSRIYLQREKNLLQLDKPGIYALAEIQGKSGSILADGLRFLAALAKPRSFTQQVRARGPQDVPKQADADFFESVWESVVRQDRGPKEPVPEEDLLAAAAWFHQHGKSARTAYILEQLNSTSESENPFYRQLRNDSLRGIPLSDINGEVEKTRQAMQHQAREFRYRALLIGVDKYDHPAWQNLDNPIADVRSIRSTLLEFYRFQPQDITILENPSFSEIIDGFQDLKRTVDNNTRLIIYFAGHGYYPTDEEEGYWIPRDGGDPETQQFFIPTSIILSKMKAIKSRQTLLITDSCFSGSLIRKSRGAIVDSGYYRELSEKRSRQIITSGGLEPVSDSGGGDHSVFAGNLLQILSEKRESPLSASELAIELRKTLKNSGVLQTPEYGRLYTADDESGEFFFVRRDQPLVYAERPEGTPRRIESEDSVFSELEIIGMSSPTRAAKFAFQSRGSEDWLSIGVVYHQGFLEYNYLHTEQGSTPKTINISSALVGTGLMMEARRTNHKGGYGLTADFGQFIRTKTCANNDNTLSGIGVKTCDEEDGEDRNQTSLSGYFTHLGLFTDYSVLVYREISVQLGGILQHQYYKFDNFLDKDTLNSSTLGACGKGTVSYRKSGWTARLLVDFCLTVLEISGSLHELNEDHASDLRLLAGMRAGFEAGFLY